MRCDNTSTVLVAHSTKPASWHRVRKPFLSSISLCQRQFMRLRMREAAGRRLPAPSPSIAQHSSTKGDATPRWTHSAQHASCRVSHRLQKPTSAAAIHLASATNAACKVSLWCGELCKAEPTHTCTHRDTKTHHSSPWVYFTSDNTPHLLRHAVLLQRGHFAKRNARMGTQQS